jgi:hypothetical protein
VYVAGHVFRIKDINGESIVVDGGWIEKLRLHDSKARAPAADYIDTQVTETSRRKRVLFGDKEELLQVLVNVGTFMSLTVRADQRAEVDELIAALERAKSAAA